MVDYHLEQTMYCPKCKSKLYPMDKEYIEATGVCSYCVTYDNTPDKKLRKAYLDFKNKDKGTINDN